MTKPAPKARFFPTQAAWRKWLATNHKNRSELWVGFWRRATGNPSITWPQSVDEALCFGWIDGLRRGLDAESYMIRFTPRKARGRWSRVNLKRYAELETEGLVKPAGRIARAQWKETGSRYSYEARPKGLDRPAQAALNMNTKARRFWDAQIPSYQRLAAHWVSSAKRPETRSKRLSVLIDCCARGKAIPPVAKYVKMKKP
jgi:uncharacterized protein YdeI (YjbR/CyaY-like superfamily)